MAIVDKSKGFSAPKTTTTTAPKTTTTAPRTTTTRTSAPINQYGGAGTNYGPIATSVTQRADATSLQIANAGGETQYRPPARYVFIAGKKVLSDAPGLVNSYGNLVRNYYDLDTEPSRLYYSTSPASRDLLLRQLVASGFLDESSIGDPNIEIRAITAAMGDANVMGFELANFLQQRVAAGGGRKGGWSTSGGRGGAGPIRVYQQSSPADLLTLVKGVAQDTMGRELSDQEAAQFISDYQSQQVAFQRAAESGGVITEPPSAQVAATNYIKNKFGREESAYQYLGYMNMLFDSIGVQ